MQLCTRRTHGVHGRQAMHRLCCVCATAAMQLSIHACQCVLLRAGGPGLGCTDLRCPSTSRARTQQHTRRTGCTSTRTAAAAEEGCMHALCTHALCTWYDMHSIAGHFLIPAKPKDGVMMAVLAPARERSAGITIRCSGSTHVAACPHAALAGCAHSQSTMCQTPHLKYLRTHAWHHDGRGGDAHTTHTRGECNATHSECTAHSEPHVLRR
jgi:hypothetical protein